jgi:hypothetical protein
MAHLAEPQPVLLRERVHASRTVAIGHDAAAQAPEPSIAQCSSHVEHSST